MILSQLGVWIKKTEVFIRRLQYGTGEKENGIAFQKSSIFVK